MNAPLSEVKLASIMTTNEPQGTVALAMRDQMAQETVISLLGTHWPDNVDKRFIQGSILTLQRNALIAAMRGEWILFIDDDMVWEPDAVTRLVKRFHELGEQGLEVDILGALCFRRGHPFNPTLYMRKGDGQGPYTFLENWGTDVVEVDATGMAFALVSLKCLERLGGPLPPYEERANSERHPDYFQWRGAMGEDLRFCQDVKALGGRVFVDTTIQTRHIGSLNIGLNTWLGAMAARPQGAFLEVQADNDALDLPTLSPDEAAKWRKTL